MVQHKKCFFIKNVSELFATNYYLQDKVPFINCVNNYYPHSYTNTFFVLLNSDTIYARKACVCVFIYAQCKKASNSVRKNNNKTLKPKSFFCL